MNPQTIRVWRIVRLWNLVAAAAALIGAIASAELGGVWWIVCASMIATTAAALWALLGTTKFLRDAERLKRAHGG